MGGNAFQEAQKLTNKQYNQITLGLIQKLSCLCTKIQPYIPLPQKQIHGDIDFLVILKPQYTAIEIVNNIDVQKYKLRSSHELNTLYLNKQVDFLFVNTLEQFQICLFYKSFSGFGGFLGLLLPSKIVKFTHFGLIGMRVLQNIKFQFVISINVKEILEFYGLDYEKYIQGFKTKKQIFQFMRKARFLNEQKYANYQGKGRSKIMIAFAQYLKQKGFDKQRQTICFQNVLKQTLQYFKKQQQFQAQFQKLLDSIERRQILNKKFNGTHIIEKFQFNSLKQVDKCKQKFRQLFKNIQEYYQFVQKTQIQQILKMFGQKMILKEKQYQQKVE